MNFSPKRLRESPRRFQTLPLTVTLTLSAQEVPEAIPGGFVSLRERYERLAQSTAHREPARRSGAAEEMAERVRCERVAGSRAALRSNACNSGDESDDALSRLALDVEAMLAAAESLDTKLARAVGECSPPGQLQRRCICGNGPLVVQDSN